MRTHDRLLVVILARDGTNIESGCIGRGVYCYWFTGQDD
jgi:hypothetical protein